MVIEMDLSIVKKSLIQKIGEWFIRYGLVVVLAWIGVGATLIPLIFGQLLQRFGPPSVIIGTGSTLLLAL